MNKEIKIEKFLKSLRDTATNVTDGPVTDIFKGSSPFRVVCIKCGTMDVSVIGESGGCGSPETGHWPGSLTLKCHKCGAAQSCNDIY